MKTSTAQISNVSASSDTVTLMLDGETLAALNTAVEAGSEIACSVLLSCDDSTRA
jgi:hypothetical protein